MRLDDTIVEPHVCDSHAILSQRACLIGADRRRRAQSFDRLQILHQTVLAGHPFSGQRQAYLEHIDTDISSFYRSAYIACNAV